LARDLGERLGMPACLSALRRTASGAFTLDDAQSLDSELTITPIAQAVRRCLPAATLNEEGVARARCGGPMTREHFSAAPRDDTFSAWLGPDGRLVAIGSSDGGAPRVVRGFDSV
jgi:tRNA pseudouridine55 synthase